MSSVSSPKYHLYFLINEPNLLTLTSAVSRDMSMSCNTVDVNIATTKEGQNEATVERSEKCSRAVFSSKFKTILLAASCPPFIFRAKFRRTKTQIGGCATSSSFARPERGGCALLCLPLHSRTRGDDARARADALHALHTRHRRRREARADAGQGGAACATAAAGANVVRREGDRARAGREREPRGQRRVGDGRRGRGAARGRGDVRAWTG